MFRYFLAFLLINTCYQSLGNPIQPKLSKSLETLATKCNNSILSKYLVDRIKDCAVSGMPPYSKKQIQCLILYDISTQLCSAMVTSKLIVNEDSFKELEEKQDVNAVCTLAKEWVFTNLSDFEKYQDSAEMFFKGSATCGEVCGAEDDMTEANFYCKYYKMGLGILKAQLATVANNAVVAPIISDPDVTSVNSIPANSDPVKPEDTNTKTINSQIKQTESDVAKTTPQKVEVAIDDTVVKSETVAQATSKQTPSIEVDNSENAEDSDVNVRQENTAAAAPDSADVQDNKTVVVQAEKPAIGNEVVIPDLPVAPIGEQKQAGVKENPKSKAIVDAEEYETDDGDEDPNDDTALEVKPEQQPANQQNYVPNNLVVPAAHEAEVSQKEFFPNTMPDGFSDEDDDHFFPFFMTSVLLMVLLYVLYHNKSKVSKVFFGLILEGRQSGRRRNSRGHAYRRLDTLEQAMSANTAAPPSKIIY